jgi:hypothetical protein
MNDCPDYLTLIQPLAKETGIESGYRLPIEVNSVYSVTDQLISPCYPAKIRPFISSAVGSCLHPGLRMILPLKHRKAGIPVIVDFQSVAMHHPATGMHTQQLVALSPQMQESEAQNHPV